MADAPPDAPHDSPHDSPHAPPHEAPHDAASSVAPPDDLLVRELSELTLPLMWLLRQEAVRAFEPLGIRPIKALLLELVARGMCYPKELSEVLDTVPPAISAMLAELEAKGWLSRAPDPDDRRRVRLELTASGRALLDEMRERWDRAGRTRLAHMSAEELRTLIALYRKLLGGLAGAAAPAPLG